MFFHDNVLPHKQRVSE